MSEEEKTMSEEQILIDRALLRRIYDTLTDLEYAGNRDEYYPSCPLCYSSDTHDPDCPLAQILAEPTFQALIEEIEAERRNAPRHRSLKVKSKNA